MPFPHRRSARVSGDAGDAANQFLCVGRWFSVPGTPGLSWRLYRTWPRGWFGNIAPEVVPLRLIRTREIRLTWDGDKICALAGNDLPEGVSGFGDDVPEALADLVNRIRSEETTIWVPRPAKQFIADGVVKCSCPECGHIREMGAFDEVIAYVCECGAGVDVEPLQHGGV